MCVCVCVCVLSQCCKWRREYLAVGATLWTTFTKSRVNLHATQFNAKLLSHLMVNFSTVVPNAGEKGFFLRYVHMLCFTLWDCRQEILSWYHGSLLGWTTALSRPLRQSWLVVWHWTIFVGLLWEEVQWNLSLVVAIGTAFWEDRWFGHLYRADTNWNCE